jgi:glutamyl-tRNA synthetase
VFAYQLAVVVDDLAMAVTDVVRGADLASSAPRQVLLAKLLGGHPPRFAHLPLVLGEGGERLAKRARGVPLSDQRARGVAPGSLVRALAGAYGFDLPEGVGRGASDSLDALASRFDWDRLRGRTVTVEAIERRLAGERG